MDDLETQDRNIEYLKSFYDEEFEELADIIWDTDPDDYIKLEDTINNLLEDFATTCTENYGITDVNHYFELLLIEYDLPSLMEFTNDTF